MLYRSRKVTWFIIALYASIIGGGEALHFLPGLGHAVQLPNGQLLYLGIAPPSETFSQSPAGARVEDPSDNPIPIRDSGSCPICRHCSYAPCLTEAIQIVSAPILVHDLPSVTAPPVHLGVAHPFQGRAPPEA
jgi:hypothetical protein